MKLIKGEELEKEGEKKKKKKKKPYESPSFSFRESRFVWYLFTSFVIY